MKLRAILIAACVLGVSALAGLAEAAEKGDFRVTLLGTGSPIPLPDRFGPATLAEVGGQKFLFDAGRGVTIRLWQRRIPYRSVDVLFLTHFHSDHVSGIPDLWLTGWLGGPFGRRATPFRVIGPVGTKELTDNLERAYGADIRIRIADEGYPPEGIRIAAEEFGAEGVVYEKSGVKVTAFSVDHGEKIKPSYGYRIDYDGRSAVISGDTRFDENLIRHAMGIDLLVHEVAAARPELMTNPQVKRVIGHHTTPQEAGTVFSRARPKLAVFTHLVMIARDKVAPLTVDELIAQTRETYDGPLQVGEDLMSFDITKDGVVVHRPAR
jgi:ribonuclease Z